MGWLWGSTTSASDGVTTPGREGPINGSQPQTSEASIGLTEAQRQRFFGRANNASQESHADKELEGIFSSLIAEDATSQIKKKYIQSTSTTTDTSNTTPTSPPSKRIESHDRFLPDGSTNIHPDALYPSTMSCREAFDAAFYCQSLGGKFNDIYRYGQLRSCSDHWGAFWFCMRARTLPAAERAAKIREHYAARDEKKVKEFGGSSEDIWDIRTVGVTRAFHMDPDADDDGNGNGNGAGPG